MPNQKTPSATYENFHDSSAAVAAFRSESSRVGLHFHRRLELIYLTEGVVTATVNGRDFRAKADEIVFVYHYQKHGYAPAPAYKKLVLVLPAEFTADFSARLTVAALPAHMADTAFNRRLKPYFETLTDRAEPRNELIDRGCLDLIFGHLFEHYPAAPPRRGEGERLIVDILDYIDRHYKKPLSLDALATAFGYNKYYFSKLWTQNVGENLNNYINNVRLQHLTARAAADKSKISDLAYDCGFDSLTTFYRCFTRRYQTSPKKYFTEALTAR